MAEQIGLNWTDPNSVRKAIKVEAPREIAWQTFTEQMRTWWPLAVTRSVRQTRSMLSSTTCRWSRVAGRVLYFVGYRRAVKKRLPGFVVQSSACMVFIGAIAGPVIHH
jgi:hypothetical protein